MIYKKIIVTAIAVILVCIIGAYYLCAHAAVSIDENEYYPVSYVVDGDTFKVKIGWHIITIRMLGIDTPETVDPRKPVQCFGPEASEETKEILSGRNVQLKLSPNREENDRYGRYLAYTHRDDGMFVNEYLVKEGFAREYTYGKAYSLQTEFRSAESAAKELKKGLWGKCSIEKVSI